MENESHCSLVDKEFQDSKESGTDMGYSWNREGSVAGGVSKQGRRMGDEGHMTIDLVAMGRTWECVLQFTKPKVRF